MINGLGIVGWGVGGIEAEAGMLGQPVYFLARCRRRASHRRDPEGVTATDVALTVTQMLRKAGSSASSSSSSAGAAALPLVDRATIANMAPGIRRDDGLLPDR